MNLSFDTVAMGIIVLGALVWAVRAVLNAARSKKICSTCGSDGDCPLSGSEDNLQDIQLGPPDSSRKP